MDAEQFEKFLHTSYVGQKRFFLEGGETLIPVLDAIIQASPSRGVFKIAMGMAHRGRLNVLANILGKDYKFLFDEFSDNYVQQVAHGDGDVKYHLGFENTRTTVDGGKVSINLAPNPSHLEAVTPVVQQGACAFSAWVNDSQERKKGIAGGDPVATAAIGQGIVAETFNMSQLDGYKTGGTVHIVVNNQIGFTTLPHDARSTLYCTATAKMLDVPIFHVNGNDPVAAVHCIEMALDFRQQFGRDVVVDIVCYRKHGHNEGDEPSARSRSCTPPSATSRRRATLFADKLIEEGVSLQASRSDAQDEYRPSSIAANPSRKHARMIGNEYTVDWAPSRRRRWDDLRTPASQPSTDRRARQLPAHPKCRRSSSCTRSSAPDRRTRREMARAKAAWTGASPKRWPTAR